MKHLTKRAALTLAPCLFACGSEVVVLGSHAEGGAPPTAGAGGSGTTSTSVTTTSTSSTSTSSTSTSSTASGGAEPVPCTPAWVEPEPVVPPVDVIMVVDNSGSMFDEIAAIEQNVNVNFAQVFATSGLDFQLVVVSDHGVDGL